MNLADVLTEIGTVLATTGVRVYTSPPDAGDLPAIVVNPPTSITYTQTYAGNCILELPITIYTSNKDLASAWSLLYQLLSYNLQGATPVADALLSHTPIAYKSFHAGIVAKNFRPVGDYAIAADVILTIIS